MLVAALYCYLVALPIGYVYAAGWLGCGRRVCCGAGCGWPKRTPIERARSAAVLYMADNPGRCPTVEDLVNERYLAKTGARGMDIRCDSGEVELLEPASTAPTFRMKWKRRTCGALRVGVELWEAPFRVLIWAWRSTGPP